MKQEVFSLMPEKGSVKENKYKCKEIWQQNGFNRFQIEFKLNVT